MDINWMGWIGVGSPRYNSKSNTIGLQISPCKELPDKVYTDTDTDTVYKFHLAKSSQTIGLQISPCKKLPDKTMLKSGFFLDLQWAHTPVVLQLNFILTPLCQCLKIIVNVVEPMMMIIYLSFIMLWLDILVSSHPRRATIKYLIEFTPLSCYN